MKPPDSIKSKAQTYSSYLKLDELLSLQKPLSPEHDEMLFVIVHQVYELWFKQIIHEFIKLQKSLESGSFYESMQTLQRVLKILKTLVGQIDIIETMSPVSYNSFRPYLGTSSGFQSFQFRKVEFILGKKNKNVIEHYKEQPQYALELKQSLSQPTLIDSFFRYLKQKNYKVPKEVLNRDFTQTYKSNPEMKKTLKEIYFKKHKDILICDLMIDLDEGFQEWRYRHVKMVERMIGLKMGTGGSEGVKYLQTTLFQPLFSELWEIRTEI